MRLTPKELLALLPSREKVDRRRAQREGETDEGPPSMARPLIRLAASRRATFSLEGRRAMFLVSVFFAPSFATPAAADFESCRATYAEIGLPKRLGESDTGEVKDRCFKGFALLHNARTKTPDWVIESLTIDSFRGQATRSKSAFATDTVIAEGQRAELKDYESLYQGQSFDRGHQAPAANDKSSQEAMNETFVLSNMAPQVGIGFNRHAWAYLEKAIRGWIVCGGREHLYVMTGPVYSTDANKVLGPNKVAIPDAFYKIIHDPVRHRAIAFVLENKRHTGRALDPFLTSIAHIEELTGIDFLPNLTERDQTVLESHVAPMWAYDRGCDMRE